MGRTLYHLQDCPHCEQVRLALAIEKLPFEEVRVEPSDRSAVRSVSGQDSVPVLVEEDGTVYVDARRILRHLAQRPGSRLLPEGRRDQALTWVLAAHAGATLGPLTGDLARGASAGAGPLDEDEKRRLERRLDEEIAVLDGLLDRGPFLFGDRPTVADITVHAYLSRLPRGEGGAPPIPAARSRVVAWYRHVEDAAGRP